MVGITDGGKAEKIHANILFRIERDRFFITFKLTFESTPGCKCWYSGSATTIIIIVTMICCCGSRGLGYRVSGCVNHSVVVVRDWTIVSVGVLTIRSW